MKKNVLISAAFAAMVLTSCGTTPLSALAAQNTNATTASNVAGSAVSGLLQSVIGKVKLTQNDLIGTWHYSQPGCAFTSENLLAQAGGEMVASEIRTKLLPAYQKVGLKGANTQVTFKQDGTFTAKIAGKSWAGTYTFDDATSKITLTGLLLNVNCYAKRNTDGISLLFEAKKLLTLIQTMSALSSNQTVQAMGELSSNYDGLRVGFDMKK